MSKKKYQPKITQVSKEMLDGLVERALGVVGIRSWYDYNSFGKPVMFDGVRWRRWSMAARSEDYARRASIVLQMYLDVTTGVPGSVLAMPHNQVNQYSAGRGHYVGCNKWKVQILVPYDHVITQ